jgi:hypothetical protein
VPEAQFGLFNNLAKIHLGKKCRFRQFLPGRSCRAGKSCPPADQRDLSLYQPRFAMLPQAA